MGNVATRDIYDKSGPKTGPGLDTLAKNQGAMREGVGMLPPKGVTIQDGAITGFEEAALIVDTEGGAAADDLNVISDVISATEKLHPGMLITLRAQDPARVVTVKNSASANGINTADGHDIVLSPNWSLTLRLVGGRWYEERGRSSALADAAQSTANDAKSVTDKVTPTPTPNAIPQADADGDVWGLAKKDMNNLTQAGTTAIANYAAINASRYVSVSKPSVSGGTIEAPIDGCLCFKAQTTAANGSVLLASGSYSIVNEGVGPLSGWGISALIPVSKGTLVNVVWTNATNFQLRCHASKGAF